MMETLNLLFDETDDAIVMINRKSECLRSNPVSARMLGVYPGVMLDKVVQHDEQHCWTTFMDKVMPGKKVTSRFNLRTENGRDFKEVEVTGTVFRHSNDVILRFKLGSQMPDSALQGNGNRGYQSIFRNAFNCFVVVNKNGIIHDVNNRMEYFFGITPDEIIGQDWTFVSRIGITEQEIQGVYEGIKENGKAEMKHRHITEDGEERHYHCHVYFDEAEEMYVCTIRDDTEKVMMRQQMEHNGSLTALGQLAASIAHELKNAMTTVRGFTDLLKLSEDSSTDRYLGVIDSEMDRMESLMSEFLMLSKPSNQEDQPFELYKCLCDVVIIMEPQATMRAITIIKENHIRDDVIVKGKPQRMKQAFINLIKNALEASGPDTRLMVSIENYDENHVVVAFSDEGKGMTEIQLKQIFLPFFTTKREGTGLGLPFVLETAESMGGHLFIKSVPAKGSRIEILLPVYTEETSENEKEILLLR